MCKGTNESVDALSLHCSFVRELWSYIDIQWVVTKSATDRHISWQDCLVSSERASFRRLIHFREH